MIVAFVVRWALQAKISARYLNYVSSSRFACCFCCAQHLEKNIQEVIFRWASWETSIEWKCCTRYLLGYFLWFSVSSSRFACCFRCAQHFEINSSKHRSEKFLKGPFVDWSKLELFRTGWVVYFSFLHDLRDSLCDPMGFPAVQESIGLWSTPFFLPLN